MKILKKFKIANIIEPPVRSTLNELSDNEQNLPKNLKKLTKTRKQGLQVAYNLKDKHDCF